MKNHHCHQEEARVSPKKPLRGKLEENRRKTGRKLEENRRKSGGKNFENSLKKSIKKQDQNGAKKKNVLVLPISKEIQTT